MIAIGIDPGVNGGIAALDATGDVILAAKMPATEQDLYRLISQLPLNRGILDTDRRAVLEKAQPMPKQGVVSVFTYGRGYGALLMVLTAAEIPFDEVTSPVWQQAMGCRSHGDKNVTKRRAQQLFPRRTITHAIADALLLAEFCRRRALRDPAPPVESSPAIPPARSEEDQGRRRNRVGRAVDSIGPKVRRHGTRQEESAGPQEGPRARSEESEAGPPLAAQSAAARHGAGAQPAARQPLRGPGRRARPDERRQGRGAEPDPGRAADDGAAGHPGLQTRAGRARAGARR